MNTPITDMTVAARDEEIVRRVWPNEYDCVQKEMAACKSGPLTFADAWGDWSGDLPSESVDKCVKAMALAGLPFSVIRKVLADGIDAAQSEDDLAERVSAFTLDALRRHQGELRWTTRGRKNEES